MSLGSRSALSGSGGAGGLQPTIEMPQTTSTYSPSISVDLGVDSDHVIKASAGNVYGFSMRNKSAVRRYAMFFDSATVPAEASTPVLVFQVEPWSQLIVGREFFSLGGIHFASGIVFVVSEEDVVSNFLTDPAEQQHQVVYK